METNNDNKQNVSSGDKTKWVATWGSAQLKAGSDHLPKTVKLTGATLRQQIRTTIEGDVIKLTLTNEYGEKDLIIESVHIAHLGNPQSSSIDKKTDTVVTFGGKEAVTVKKGQRLESDVIEFEFDALDDLAITMYIKQAPSTVTSHTASRCSTWTVSGNHVSDVSTNGGDTTTAWYFLTRADTLATEETGVVVAFGDSLTDGASVTTNAFNRWTDEFARLLKKDSELSHYGVINMGIGGTLLTWDIARFERDVLNTPGVKAVVVLYGINDIANTTRDKSNDIINLYKQIIRKCEAKGIKVYCGTLTPTKGNTGGYYSNMVNTTRLNINKWIMSENSGLDGYIDFASAVATAADSDKMQSQYVSVWNDWLHFNDQGYKKLGQTAYGVLKDELE